MSKTLTATVLAVLLLCLGGCGGSDAGDSSGSKPSASAPAAQQDATAARSIADSLVKSGASAGATSQLLTVKRADADCIGKGLVDEIGTAKLQRYGLLTKDMKVGSDVQSLTMSAPDASTAARVTTGCTDLKARLLAAVSSSGSLPRSTRACISRSLDDASIRRALTNAFQGKQAAAQKALTTPLLVCAKSAG